MLSKALIHSKSKVIVTGLLLASLAWVPNIDAAPKADSKQSVEMSDLNSDGTVDYADLVVFSSTYLGQSVDTVDWCAFSDATRLHEKLYGRSPKYYINSFGALLTFIVNKYDCDRSDLDTDGRISTKDLAIFSIQFLELNWETVAWCDFYTATVSGGRFSGKPTDYYQLHFRYLIGFTKDHYGCDTGPLLLQIKHQPKSLFRMAAATDGSGDYYVSDPRVNSVFIYDPNLALVGEIKNLDKPLGIAIDTQGYLLVGNDGRNNIEVYDPGDGQFLASFGEGQLRMPTAITVGPGGEIYVTDSRNNNIRVFDSTYILIRTIGSQGSGEAELDFPTDAVIVSHTDGGTPVQELYVADQVNHRIQTYDLEGNFIKTIDPPPPPPPPVYDNNGNRCGWFNPPPECTPTGTKFTRLQALTADAGGRLHVLDIFEADVAIIDVGTGELVDTYGQYGNGPGQLKNPVDVLLTTDNTALVTDARSDEMEVFAIP